MRVLHVITHLEAAGAQRMLSELTAHRSLGIDHDVVSLRSNGAVADAIMKTGVSVTGLGLSPARPPVKGLATLARMLKRRRPDVVQTWLYHGDLVGGLAARMAGIPVLWNIRHSDLDPATIRRSTIAVAHVNARLSSRVPSGIVCCSEASRRTHAAIGYDEDRMITIPNGFDLDKFRPDPDRRCRVRWELGIDESAFVVGHVARFAPQKDHATFLAAISQARVRNSRIVPVLIGEGHDSASFRKLLQSHGLTEVAVQLGRRDDVDRITPIFDLAVVSARSGEGFPNVLGEAMAAGVPCLTTDTGDSARIVGVTGLVVPPGDRAEMAAGILRMSTGADLETLGALARARIREHFSLATAVGAYERLWLSFAPSTDPPLR